MIKDDIYESLDAGMERIAVATYAAHLEVERLAAERIASATLAAPPSTGNVSVDIEDPKLLTLNDLVQALEKQNVIWNPLLQI